MAFKYIDGKHAVCDQVRKLTVRKDIGASRDPDDERTYYQILDENGNRISGFQTVSTPTVAAENARCGTKIILHNTIVPHPGISVECIAEALHALIGKGDAHEEEFTTIAWAQNMFVVQESYPGRFPNFEHWARSYNHPISDGSKLHDANAIKILRQPGEPGLDSQDGIPQPNAESYYPGSIRPVPLTLVPSFASTYTFVRIGEIPDQIAARYGVGQESDFGFVLPGTTVVSYIKGGYAPVVYFLNGRSFAERIQKLSNTIWTDKEVGDFLKIVSPDDSSELSSSPSSLFGDISTDAGSRGIGWTYSQNEKLWHWGDKSIVAYLKADRRNWLCIVNRGAMKKLQVEGAPWF